MPGRVGKLPSKGWKATERGLESYRTRHISLINYLKNKYLTIMKRMYLITPLICAALAGCGVPTGEQVVHSVLLTSPRPNSEGQTLDFSGIVREAGEISLGFKTAGQINHIAVDEGDFVRQGQLIATLDDADYRLGVEALQVQYDQLTAEVKRLEQLYKAKSVSANDYEKAVAGLKQLGVQLQVNKNKLDYTRLCAPVSGYVREVNFDEAEMVNAGTPVISLLDVGGMEVELDVPATVYRRQADIERITCQTADTPAKSISMKLLSLTPKADATQLYRMRLGFSSTPDASLTAGRNVQVSLRLAETDSLRNFVLPLASLFQEQGESYVWTVGGDSLINRMKVSVQGTTPEGRAIVAGLRGDESVVRAGVHALREGEKVRVIDESSETNVGGQL